MRTLLVLVIIVLLAGSVLADNHWITPEEFRKAPTNQNFLLLKSPTSADFQALAQPTLQDIEFLAKTRTPTTKDYAYLRTKNVEAFKDFLNKPTVNFQKDGTARDVARDYLQTGIPTPPDTKSVALAGKYCLALGKTAECAFGTPTTLSLGKDGKTFTVDAGTGAITIDVKQDGLKGAKIIVGPDGMTIVGAKKQFSFSTPQGDFKVTPTKDTKFVTLGPSNVFIEGSGKFTHSVGGKLRGTYTNDRPLRYMDIRFNDQHVAHASGTWKMTGDALGVAGETYYLESLFDGGSVDVEWKGGFPLLRAADSIKGEFPALNADGTQHRMKLYGDWENVQFGPKGVERGVLVNLKGISDALPSTLPGDTVARITTNCKCKIAVDFVTGKTDIKTLESLRGSATVSHQALIASVEQRISELTKAKELKAKELSDAGVKDVAFYTRSYDDDIKVLEDKREDLSTATDPGYGAAAFTPNGVAGLGTVGLSTKTEEGSTHVTPGIPRMSDNTLVTIADGKVGLENIDPAEARKNALYTLHELAKKDPETVRRTLSSPDSLLATIDTDNAEGHVRSYVMPGLEQDPLRMLVSTTDPKTNLPLSLDPNTPSPSVTTPFGTLTGSAVPEDFFLALANQGKPTEASAGEKQAEYDRLAWWNSLGPTPEELEDVALSELLHRALSEQKEPNTPKQSTPPPTLPEDKEELTIGPRAVAPTTGGAQPEARPPVTSQEPPISATTYIPALPTTPPPRVPVPEVEPKIAPPTLPTFPEGQLALTKPQLTTAKEFFPEIKKKLPSGYGLTITQPRIVGEMVEFTVIPTETSEVLGYKHTFEYTSRAETHSISFDRYDALRKKLNIK